AFPFLFLVGLPGIGKTSIAYTVAKAMNREFIRIPMGGMGSALQLRGESRITPEAEPGQVIKGLRRAQTKNPVILLDEIDRTAEQARAQIMGVLLELLDPEQNFEFTDYFINYPFDLSEVVFLASANNTAGISNAVLDRMEVIKMPGYTDDEKIVIARDYLLPRQLKITGMPEGTIVFAPDVWPSITRPFGYDAGIRTMSRMINSVVRKAAIRMAEGRGETFEITNENIKDFLPSV
ncbi:MAG: AAA family ATPase, partial [Planctomycetaceae bacterium]|nr:AAA family ATPase [Planctomycetaceae bacterium]